MEDKALGLNPDYLEAMTYKNILLRMQANTEKDPKVQKDLINKADQLRNKVMDMQKRQPADRQRGSVGLPMCRVGTTCRHLLLSPTWRRRPT